MTFHMHTKSLFTHNPQLEHDISHAHKVTIHTQPII